MTNPIPNSTYRKAFYLEKYASLTINDACVKEAKNIAGAINQNLSSYGLISSPFGIKAIVPGILHWMESGGDFTCHLANGDPLSADTVDVPAHLMAKYYPQDKAPFDFVRAGLAALQDYKEGWNSLVITDIPSMLQFFDQYNGLDPWKHAAIGPDGSLEPQIAYLFSGTSAYQKGKMTSDGVWNPDFVSEQIGAAAIMKALGL